MSTLDKINNASSVRKLWEKLNNETILLCDNLDGNGGEVGIKERELIESISETINSILRLKQNPNYNPNQYLETLDGSKVFADAAISGALMMFQDLEATIGCNFKINKLPIKASQQVEAKASHPVTNKTSNEYKYKKPFDIGSLVWLLVCLGVALWSLYVGVVAIANGISGRIELIVGLIIGGFLLTVAAFSSFYAYMLFREEMN